MTKMVGRKGLAYKCLHCDRENKKYINDSTHTIAHIFKNHVKLTEVPFYCSLCMFRSQRLTDLHSHVKKYAHHKLRLDNMTEKPTEETYLHTSKNPYKIGEIDMMQLSKEETKTLWKSREQKNDTTESPVTLQNTPKAPQNFTAERRRLQYSEVQNNPNKTAEAKPPPAHTKVVLTSPQDKISSEPLDLSKPKEDKRVVIIDNSWENNTNDILAEALAMASIGDEISLGGELDYEELTKTLEDLNKITISPIHPDVEKVIHREYMPQQILDDTVELAVQNQVLTLNKTLLTLSSQLKESMNIIRYQGNKIRELESKVTAIEQTPVRRAHPYRRPTIRRRR